MQSSQNGLIHEAAAVFRLVSSIETFVAEQNQSYTYIEATQEFFQHIVSIARATRAQVSHIVQQSALRPEENDKRLRPQLIIQKHRWKTLHTYIKPAADAHTLLSPTALIRLATDHLRRAKGMEGKKLVVLLAPELMYFHNLPKLDLPENLVFVELPYSQGPSLFANLAIYHELGHYVYEQLTTSNPDSATFNDLTETMEKLFEEELGAQIKIPRARAWTKQVLEAWNRETFCDLFAVRLLGPAFSFELIDLLSLTGLMQGGTETTFSEQHPAPALRLREQVKLLKRDGWWDQVAYLPTDHVEVLRDLESRIESDYSFVYDDASIPRFTDTFLRILPMLYAVIDQVLPGSSEAADNFSLSKSEIESCLLHGIVPSKLIDASRSNVTYANFDN